MSHAAEHKLGDNGERPARHISGPRVVNLISQEECEREAREVAAAAAAKKAASAREAAAAAAAPAAADPRDEELERLRAEVAGLRRSCQLAAQAVGRGDTAVAAAALESVEEVSGSTPPACTSPAPDTTSAQSSEGRLRAVLTSRSSSTAELRQAIGAVEALLNEARRELAAKELRERRAAFEALHAALDTRSEERLPGAIAEARRTGCDEGDIAKCEAVLQELQSQTVDERQAKERRELVQAKKAEAFLCVKRDTPEKLSALLEDLPEGVRWQDWRDHAQRTLWRCSQDLRAEKVKSLLAPLLGFAEEEAKAGKKNRRNKASKKTDGSDAGSPSSASPASPSPAPAASPVSQPSVSFSTSPPASPGPPMRRPRSPSSRLHAVAPTLSAEDAFSRAFESIGSGWATSEATSIPGSPSSIYSPHKPPAESDDEKIKKAKAFRAVANNNDEALQEVIECVSVETMQRWRNKAGESLLVVAEKRRSVLYAQLAKAFGIAREQHRESYEERQAVWVYSPGEPQPRQATVLEDSPEDADEVLLEYWDGDEPAVHIDKNRVRPSWS